MIVDFVIKSTESEIQELKKQIVNQVQDTSSDLYNGQITSNLDNTFINISIEQPSSTQDLVVSGDKIQNILKTDEGLYYLDKNNDNEYNEETDKLVEDITTDDLISNETNIHLNKTYKHILLIDKDNFSEEYKNKIVNKIVIIDGVEVEIPVLFVKFNEINDLLKK